jgi:hypothetical protein
MDGPATMTDPKPQIHVKLLNGRRVRLTAKRGVLTTEATLTEAEWTELASQLTQLLRDINGTGVTP